MSGMFSHFYLIWNRAHLKHIWDNFIIFFSYFFLRCQKSLEFQKVEMFSKQIHYLEIGSKVIFMDSHAVSNELMYWKLRLFFSKIEWDFSFLGFFFLISFIWFIEGLYKDFHFSLNFFHGKFPILNDNKFWVDFFIRFEIIPVEQFYLDFYSQRIHKSN